jgi:hypothetical protein
MKVCKEENILGAIINSNNNNNSINICQYIFKRLHKFKYLGTLINNKNNVYQDLKQKIIDTNRDYFSIISLFKSKLISRESQVR